MKARGHAFFDSADIVIDCWCNLSSAERRNRHQRGILRSAKSGMLRDMFQRTPQSCVSL